MIFYFLVVVFVVLCEHICNNINIGFIYSLNNNNSINIGFIYSNIYSISIGIFCMLKLPKAAFWQVLFPAEKTVMLLCVIPEPDPLSVNKDGVRT